MNDFDTLLSEQLNDLVDHETGPERPAPRFVPTEQDEPSKARPWLFAAAVIILAVGVSWASISWITRSQTPPIASPSSAVPFTNSPTPSTSGSPSATPTSAKPSSASTSTAVLSGGARIAVPTGWTLSVDAAGTDSNRKWWCLTPASTATPVPPLTTHIKDQCVISLIDLGQVLAFDPNGLEGVGHELTVCDMAGSQTAGVVDTIDVADTRSFGGRESTHSQWTQVCPNYTLHGEQYLVPTATNWAMNTDFATTTYAGVTVSSVMASVAASSTLPAGTATLWTGDRGFVRSVSKDSTGMRITIDRYQDCAVDQYVIRNDDTATTTYVVPNSATVTGADKLVAGAKVAIATNGTIVTEVDYLDF
jgi:hypothetical protein